MKVQRSEVGEAHKMLHLEIDLSGPFNNIVTHGSREEGYITVQSEDREIKVNSNSIQSRSNVYNGCIDIYNI